MSIRLAKSKSDDDSKKKANSIPVPNEKPQDVMSRSLLGATILILGQIFTKLMTFLINQLLIRFVSAHIFGITSFMEVISSGALFYCREAIRLTCQRINGENTVGATRQIINLSMIPMVLGIPVMLLFIYTQAPDISDYKFHRLSYLILYISTMVELSSEPFYNLNQFNMNFSLRTKIESFSLVLKCLVHFLAILYLTKLQVTDNGYFILLFTSAQLAYSLTLLVSYGRKYLYSDENVVKFKLRKLSTNDSYFDKSMIKYWSSLVKQLAFKYLLTEGDRFVINYLCSTEEQGIFALITNYGSLIARLLFAPVEETLRVSLTKIFSTSDQHPKSLSDKKLQMISMISQILKFYHYLILIIVIFAPLNSAFILNLLVGSKWTSSNALLYSTFKAYWIYIPFLAVNGLLEATFYSVTTSSSQINHYSKMMIGFSVSYFVALDILIRRLNMSLLGLIIANILNMSLRIVYCSRILHQFLRKDHNLSVWLLVSDKKYLYATLSAIAVYLLHLRLIGSEVVTFTQFIYSSVLGFALLCSFVFMERELLLQTVKKLFRKIKKD